MNLPQTLLSELVIDEWRQKSAFSEELAAAQQSLWKTADDGEASRILQQWLATQQPCLFGRIAAKQGLLRFCILRESDLADERAIRDKIQAARWAWKKDAFKGEAHGFIIVLLSERVARAVPSRSLRDLAACICEHYLLVPITPDQIYLDELYFEFPSAERITRRWNAGVNYFCANGDGRWWQDHRIPGGLAFSVNSVGHMAAAGKTSAILGELAKEVGLKLTEKDSKVVSLSQALTLAMKTIQNASTTPSGPATELLALADDKVSQGIARPAVLPQALEGYGYCSYRGFYHTDVTVPSVYFDAAVARPEAVQPVPLDFTYLFDPSVANPDFITTGQGLRIRDDRGQGRELDEQFRLALARRFTSEQISEEDAQHLRAQLGL